MLDDFKPSLQEAVPYAATAETVSADGCRDENPPTGTLASIDEVGAAELAKAVEEAGADNVVKMFGLDLDLDLALFDFSMPLGQNPLGVTGQAESGAEFASGPLQGAMASGDRATDETALSFPTAKDVAGEALHDPSLPAATSLSQSTCCCIGADEVKIEDDIARNSKGDVDAPELKGQDLFENAHDASQVARLSGEFATGMLAASIEGGPSLPPVGSTAPQQACQASEPSLGGVSGGIANSSLDFGCAEVWRLRRPHSAMAAIGGEDASFYADRLKESLRQSLEEACQTGSMETWLVDAEQARGDEKDGSCVGDMTLSGLPGPSGIVLPNLADINAKVHGPHAGASEPQSVLTGIELYSQLGELHTRLESLKGDNAKVQSRIGLISNDMDVVRRSNMEVVGLIQQRWG